jgi:type IV secretory pathway TraG/TraD family ATPase VirD4
VDALGYMSALEEARDRGRKFGISLMMLYQSVGQIEKHFGKDGAVSWFDSAAIVSYAVVTSPETADRISKQAGECTVEVQGTSERSNWWFGLWAKGAHAQSRMTYSTNLQKRPLILAHEVREMRRDEQIIFVAAKPALRCGRAIFFRRPEMLEGLGKSTLREGAARRQPVQASPGDAPGDIALLAAFDTRAAAPVDATTDDGAAPTGFEGEAFENIELTEMPPADDTIDRQVASAHAIAEVDDAHRADADLVFETDPVQMPASDADPCRTIEIGSMFARRPEGRVRS